MGQDGMKRDRNWIEYTVLSSPCRKQIDANKIDGEPQENYTRHTPQGDRSGELWMPGLGD
jgi:hypothetical protein